MTLKKETKTVPFEVKNISSNDEFFTFEGYASTFGNIDLGNDIIVKGAFKDSLSKNDAVPVLWQHNMQEPIGKSIDLREDEKGLYIKAILPKDDTFISGRVMPQMKVGSIKEMSIGYWVKVDEYDRDSDIRLLKEISLFEVSLVTKAMNPQALIEGFKSIEKVLKESGVESDKIEEVAKKLSESKEDEIDNVQEIDNLKDIEKSLREKGYSKKEAKTLISKVKEFSNQRDAEEKELKRDAETKAKILAELNDITKLIKQS